MLEALIAGNSSPDEMAGLAKGRLREKQDALAKALNGLMANHQRMMLSAQLRHIDYLQEEIERLSREIEVRMRPFEQAMAILDEIPGVGRCTIEQILCETGTDMSRFPTHRHMAAWAGICPGNNESAGKRKRGKTCKGNKALKTTLVQAVKAISHTKGNYLSAMYHRLAARIGKNKATVAVAHALLVIIYHMLKKGTRYCDLGANHFDELNKQAVAKRSIKRLEALGFKVTVESITTAA